MLILGPYAFALGENSLAIHGGSKSQSTSKWRRRNSFGAAPEAPEALASSLIVDPVENAQLLKTPGAVKLMYQLNHWVVK